MSIVGFMTLDAHANSNSRLGGFLLSILIPYLIVTKTLKMSGLERMVKFGIGYIAYFVIAAFVMFYKDAYSILFTGLLSCLVLSLGILYYGNQFIKPKTPK